MSLWSAMVLIVGIIAIAGVLRSRHANRDRRHGGTWVDGERQASAREKELEREVVELRERIQVLERIATDDREAKAIADEIESLKDR